MGDVAGCETSAYISLFGRYLALHSAVGVANHICNSDLDFR